MNIKVLFYKEDRGQCIQLYKKVDEKNNKEKWLARNENGLWYTVSDAPNGFCELECLIDEKIIIEVVDKKGNIYFTSEDEDNINKFPFIHKKCVQEWDIVKDQYNASREGFRKWICSYMDLDKYTEYKESMSCTVWDINWSDCYYTVEEKEVIKKFKYLGTSYEILKLHCKHKVCDEKWIEFMVGEARTDYYEYYAGWTKK